MKLILHTKKSWVILSAASLFVLLLLGYVIYSAQAWQNYDKNYQNQQSALKSDINSALALPMTQPVDRNTKLAQLESITIKLKKQQEIGCRVDTLTNWQTSISSLGDMQKQCKSAISKLDKLINTLDATTSYLGQEHKLANSLSSMVKLSAQSDETTWSALASSWHDYRAKISGLKSSGSFESTKKVTDTVVASIDAAWQELLAAHVAQDKARFVKASSSLGFAYGSLGTIAAENNKQVLLLDQQLSRDNKAAF